MSNTIKFERATVQFTPNIAVDGYRTPAGEFRVGMVGAANALGFAKGWLSQVHTRDGKALKALRSIGYEGNQLEASVSRDQGGASLPMTQLGDIHGHTARTVAVMYK